MMLWMLLAATTPSPLWVAVDDWVIAEVVHGKWGPPDRARACAAPLRLYSGGADSARPVTCAPADEALPEHVSVEPAARRGLEVSAPLPTGPRRVTSLGTNTKTYLAVVSAQHPSRHKPRLHDVRRADLDGDGTDEVVIVASSRAPGDTRPAAPDDWALVLVRWVDGQKPATITLIQHDRTGEQLGPAELTLKAVADLDGDGALELVIEDRDPWGVSLEVWRYARGTVTALVKVGMGE